MPIRWDEPTAALVVRRDDRQPPPLPIEAAFVAVLVCVIGALIALIVGWQLFLLFMAHPAGFVTVALGLLALGASTRIDP